MVTRVTRSYRVLPGGGVTDGLQGVTWDYRALQGVSRVTGGYKGLLGLQGVPGDYKGLQGITTPDVNK